jgi:hypothetical protein
MAAPGAAFAGQPGRPAGHRHAAADPGNQPQAAGSDTARRLVRACLQRPAALPRSWTGHGQRAGLGGAGLPAARRAALGPDLAATALARRPYDLRHAALSLWLNASGALAEVAARAGNSARVLHKVYLHCTDGQEDTVSQRIEDALDAGTGITYSSPRAKASGYTHRRHRPRPCPLSVREPARSLAHSPRKPAPGSPAARHAGTRP